LNHGLRLRKQIELNLKEGEKIKVSPVGEVIGLDGRAFKIDGESLLKNILIADLHIPLDINHGFDEAVGWFEKTSFEVKEDGLYASLELNNKGQELIDTRAYRYLSPVYIMGENGFVVGLDSVGLVNRPNLLNKELNEKTKKEKKLEELEELRNDIKALRNEIKDLKPKDETKNDETKKEENSSNDIEVITTALKEMNKKITLLAGKTNLEENDKKVTLSENDKKVADLLGLSHEEYLKNKES
jgi:phage I-like protein